MKKGMSAWVWIVLGVIGLIAVLFFYGEIASRLTWTGFDGT